MGELDFKREEGYYQILPFSVKWTGANTAATDVHFTIPPSHHQVEAIQPIQPIQSIHLASVDPHPQLNLLLPSTSTTTGSTVTLTELTQLIEFNSCSNNERDWVSLHSSRNPQHLNQRNQRPIATVVGGVYSVLTPQRRPSPPGPPSSPYNQGVPPPLTLTPSLSSGNHLGDGNSSHRVHCYLPPPSPSHPSNSHHQQLQLALHSQQHQNDRHPYWSQPSPHPTLTRIQAVRPDLSIAPAALTRYKPCIYLPCTPASAYYASSQYHGPPSVNLTPPSPPDPRFDEHRSPRLNSPSSASSPTFPPTPASLTPPTPITPSGDLVYHTLYHTSPSFPWSATMAEQRAAQPVASPPKADQPTILELSQEEVAQSAQTVEDPAQQHHDATIHHDATVAAVQAVEQHVQPDAAYAQLQQDQWGGQQYYQVGDHLTGDYSQINGVMPLPGTEHGGEHYESDYSAVAATLSNWAETHPVDQSGAGGVDMVGGNGTGVPLGEQVHNGEVALMSTPLTEKPKKLMLACHFCRGRKLKCDGSRPTCHHCAKRSLACTYDEQVRRRGPGKRTKEMRERAAREAEQAGITALSAEQLAEHLAAHASGTPLGEPPKRAGRKRKSEAIDDEVKKARLLDEDTAAAVAAAQAMHQAEQAHHDVHSLEALSAHEMPHEMQHDLQHDMQHEMQHDMQHEMQHDMSHDMSNIDPALAGADGVGVMDLAPLEPGTLGQVIQQLNGQHQQQ